MKSIDGVLIFPNCIINKVEIQEDIFLVYIKDYESTFSLRKTENNFKKITIRFQEQYDKNFDDKIIRIFTEIFSKKRREDKNPISLHYILIGLKHYITLQQANFYNIHETDLVSTELISKDKNLCKSLKNRYRELQKNDV